MCTIALLQVEMTGSSILEYVHRLDQPELVQHFHLTPPTPMTSSPVMTSSPGSHLPLYTEDDQPADDNTAAPVSASNGLQQTSVHPHLKPQRKTPAADALWRLTLSICRIARVTVLTWRKMQDRQTDGHQPDAWTLSARRRRRP